MCWASSQVDSIAPSRAELTDKVVGETADAKGKSIAAWFLAAARRLVPRTILAQQGTGELSSRWHPR